MCAKMTDDDLKAFIREITAAHGFYEIDREPVTKEKLFLAIQDAHMAMIDDSKETRL